MKFKPEIADTATAAPSRRSRISLHVKAVVILALVVVGVTVSSAWLYYIQVRSWLSQRDRAEADRIAAALAMACRSDLAEGRHDGLPQLLRDFIAGERVGFVAVVNADGAVIARAARPDWRAEWTSLLALPPSISHVQQTGGTMLLHARPIVAEDPAAEKRRIVGAGRMVLDISRSARELRAVHRRISIIAAAIVVCAMPLAYLLIWRVVVQPVDRLVRATRRLGDGDFAARADLNRNDEIGELGWAFDNMAADVAYMRDQLLRANDELEQTVAERTAELHRTNNRLRDEIGQKQEFLQAVSHDLNAPLRNIAGLTQMLELKHAAELPDDARDKLRRIRTNAEGCGDLIGELLELSRIRTRPQRREPVDFNELLVELAGAFEFDLNSRHIVLSIQPGLPVLTVERMRLRQAFQNLIDNAIKYMDRPEGGRIEVGCRADDRQVAFYVRDNGPGIAPEDLDRVFTVFRRVESPQVARIAGKGVGLAVVRMVASNYQGRAWVESTPSAGSTFWFSLDRSALAETPAPARADGAREPSSSTGA